MSLHACSCKQKSSIVLRKKPHISNVSLKGADFITVLGVAIISDLWSVRAAAVRAKINNKLGVLARSGHSLDINTLCLGFISAVRSHLTYCLAVWGHLSNGDVTKMDKLISKFSKTLLLTNACDSKQLWSALRILSLNQLSAFHTFCA